MENKIKIRIIKGWNPTKKQIEYLKEYFDPKLDLNCRHCTFNLLLWLGIRP